MYKLYECIKYNRYNRLFLLNLSKPRRFGTPLICSKHIAMFSSNTSNASSVE